MERNFYGRLTEEYKTTKIGGNWIFWVDWFYGPPCSRCDVLSYSSEFKYALFHEAMFFFQQSQRSFTKRLTLQLSHLTDFDSTLLTAMTCDAKGEGVKASGAYEPVRIFIAHACDKTTRLCTTALYYPDTRF